MTINIRWQAAWSVTHQPRAVSDRVAHFAKNLLLAPAYLSQAVIPVAVVAAGGAGPKRWMFRERQGHRSMVEAGGTRWHRGKGAWWRQEGPGGRAQKQGGTAS